MMNKVHIYLLFSSCIFLFNLQGCDQKLQKNQSLPSSENSRLNDNSHLSPDKDSIMNQLEECQNKKHICPQTQIDYKKIFINSRIDSQIDIVDLGFNKDFEIIDHFPEGFFNIDNKNKITIKSDGFGTLVLKSKNSFFVLIIDSASLLAGRWKRTSHPLKGMEILFEKDLYNNWEAKVVEIPNLDAGDAQFYKKHQYDTACIDKWFPVGSLKLKTIKKIGNNLWIVDSATNALNNCQSIKIPHFNSKYTELFIDGKFFYLRDRKTSAASGGDQTWERVSD